MELDFLGRTSGKFPVWEQRNIPSLEQGSGGREGKKPGQTGQISAGKSIPAVV